MSLYPAALVFILIWFRVNLKDPDKGISVALAALPFGMFAAMAVGGVSVLMAHFLVVMTIAVFVIRRVRGAIPKIQMPRASVPLLFFGLYALFSAIILVRVFAGTFLVFPLSFDLKGTAVSIFFYSTMKPLAPSMSNIAQAGYILLTIVFFLVVADVVRRRGTEFVQIGLAWAAGLNILLGVIDLMGFDEALSLIRTADYALLNEHVLFGFSRAIGGFAEASAYGAFSSALFAYFAMSCLLSRQKWHGHLAVGNFIFAVLSFSSTGYASLFIAIVLIMLHSRHFVRQGLTWTSVHWLAIVPAVAVLALSVVMITTPLLDLSRDLVDRLFFQKTASTSGLERLAWARSGLDAFVQTWGMGAGVGSLRSNGLAAVLLGSVGLPGTLAFVAFLWSALGPVRVFANTNAMCFFYASRVSAMTYLSASLVSGTTPDPTLFLVAVSATAAMTRDANAKAPRQDRQKMASL